MTPVAALDVGILRGRFIALEPLREDHIGPLVEAGADPAIWRFIPSDPEKGFAGRLAWLRQEVGAGRQMLYAVRRLRDGAIVGSTSYLSLAPEHGRVEIGFTWYRTDAQGTAINPEAKYLLLGNAFRARFNRVEFKTDARNARSRAALLKLGATEEGIMRQHMWMPEGIFRDSVYFSILAAEWPRVRTALESRLDALSA